MELKQHLIHRNYYKAEAKNQITIGEDYSVPDGKPDIAKILQKRAVLQIGEVHTEKGKIKIRGQLRLQILYLAERSVEMAESLELEFPFDEVLYIEGAASGDHLKIDWNIDDLRVGLVHPGKLSVRAMVTLQALITATESHPITENAESNGEIHTKVESFQMAEPVLERKESYRIRDEVVLPVNKSNVEKVLWKDLQLRGLELRIQENQLAVKGELLLFVVYKGADEVNPMQWFEQTIPFHGTLEAAGLTPEMFGILETEIARQSIELKPDYDGELRSFQLELLLDIHMHVYEEQTCQILKDAYSTKEQLKLSKQEFCYEKLRMCNQAKCRVSEKKHVEEDVRILQILGHQAQMLGKSTKVREQGLLQEGTLEMQILYVTANDKQPFGCVTILIPYSQLIEIPEMKKEDHWKVSESLEQIYISMPDGNQIEVRGVIAINACVMEQCKLENVNGIAAEAYDMEEYRKKPGMVIHFVQTGETLWEIAKNNRSTMEEIQRINDMTMEEVTPGQKLLLLKPNMDNIFA